MKNITSALALLIILTGFSFAQNDAEGCKDNPLFSRLTNFYISSCSENYNELELRMSSEKIETKEGNLTSLL